MAMSDTETGREMVQLTLAERLARAVLLYHRGGPWLNYDREVWWGLTGEREITTRKLCELARLVCEDAER